MAIEGDNTQHLELYSDAIEDLKFGLGPDLDLEDLHLTWSRDSLGRQTVTVLSATTVVGEKDDTINRLIEELKSHELYLIQTYGVLNETTCLAAYLRDKWIDFMVNEWDRKTDDEGSWSTNCYFALTAEHQLILSSASDLLNVFHPRVRMSSTRTRDNLIINIKLLTSNGEVSQFQSVNSYSIDGACDAVREALTELMS